MARRPLLVALTGGVAAGKSEVALSFVKHGIEILDADVITRELVQPGQPALAEIVSAFGAEVLLPDGVLNRRLLRDRIFVDPALRHRLEAILHPRVESVLQECAAHIGSPYGILVIPLLVESGVYSWVDRVLVVDVPRELQIARLVVRDGVSSDLAQAMLAAQASREQRLAIADDVIDNTGTMTDLDRQVGALHCRYTDLASRLG